jgi:hypothetical protein
VLLDVIEPKNIMKAIFPSPLQPRLGSEADMREARVTGNGAKDPGIDPGSRRLSRLYEMLVTMIDAFSKDFSY